jgi:endonuclease/exonuclease/phosphatase family metal-dependent hydrolase
MRRKITFLLKILIFAGVVVILYLSVIIGIATVTDYKPEEISELEIRNGSRNKQISDSTFTFLSWNVGYFGLGAEMDFFYEGGKMVNPKKELVEKYSAEILNFLKSADSIDFIILQEVDKNSTRTGKLDETVDIMEILPGFSSSFGLNYNVKFVPLPITNPVGKVEMGQMNLSKYQPVSSQRHSYFSEYAWPKQLFMLDRCFVVSRFKMANGKELVLLNTHNSAYDPNGKLREVEMPLIRDFMLAEFNKGNYVIAGGDWNQNPPDYNLEKINKTYPSVIIEIMDSTMFPENWNFAYDPQRGTNRALNLPLTTGKTEVTIIDYFILSPNIEIEAIKTLSLGFQNSDHEPVFLKIKLI